MGRETGYILGEISEDEVISGRPMLSSVAVSVNGKPGPGFFTLVRDLGLLQSGEEETDFWKRQRDAAYDAWKRPLPKKAGTA